MEFRIPLMNWHAANAPTNLPSTPKEPEEDKTKYLSVMDPKRPPEVESVSDLLVRKITDIYEAAKDPGKVVSFLAREAIDPLNYLPAAPAKAAAITAGSAGILAALMKFGTIAPSKAISAGNQAGAFRPSASRLLPSSMVGLDEKVQQILKSNLPREGEGDFRLAIDKIEDLIITKVASPKELQKYGAPEFQVDPFLPHVKNPELNPTDRLAREYPLSDFLEGYKPREFLRRNQSRAEMIEDIAHIPTFLPFAAKGDAAMRNTLAQAFPTLADDARAFMGQIKDKKPIFELETLSAKNDILDGAAEMARILDSVGYTPEQLSKKTLQQLVGLARKEVRALLEKQAKSVQALTDHTVRRTVELQTKQQLPPESKGLVQLEKETDLATETAFQNICCGAGRIDQNTLKYVPAWDPITGKREPGLGQVGFSGDAFWGRVSEGDSLMFSYRPEGIPKATIELDAKTGNIREIAGKNNDPMSKELKDEVLRALAPVQARISAKYDIDRYDKDGFLMLD